MSNWTHFDNEGRARMVDISSKPATRREAVARGRVRMCEETLARLRANEVGKGDVLGVARIAGIMAAKRTSEWIPLCHAVPLSSVEVDLVPVTDPPAVEIEARVRTTFGTGVEMEALTAVSAAALTVYDMCKALERGMVIDEVRLTSKRGGQSGTYTADQSAIGDL